jgi:acetoin utilization deacetylase AcuC-like enzyme
MGYCFFNNVAIAAQHALDAHGVKRVAILDWDVHHGNGTHASFDGRDDVLFISSHQYKLFPGTGHFSRQGRGRGLGHTLSLPIAHDATDEELFWLYRRLALPVLESFRPNLMLVSAGFDAHELDHTSEQRISSDGFGRLMALLCDAADRLCQGRLVVVLEGGYSLEGLSSSLHSVIAAARDPRPWLAEPPGGPSTHLALTLNSLARVHQSRWPCLRVDTAHLSERVG